MPATIASARAQGSGTKAERAGVHRDDTRSEAAPRPEAARNDRRLRCGVRLAGVVPSCPPPAVLAIRPLPLVPPYHGAAGLIGGGRRALRRAAPRSVQGLVNSL